MSLVAPPGTQETRTIHRLSANLDLLFENLLPLASLLGEQDRIEKSDAWQAVRRRYRMLRAGAGGQPLLIATLYGPTGAGKSTLFRLLTGIPVPAGEVQRPMTYASVAAVPEEISQEKLAELFSDRVEALDDVDRLRDPKSSEDLFYFRHYSPTENQKNHRVSLVLADVPDFNTFVTANWERARRMLQQAHVVLYLCYAEAYADDKSVQELARCCQLAGRLVYLFTKLDTPSLAPEFRASLLEKLQAHPLFQERRQDGRTLIDFLRQSAMYASPRTRTLSIDDIQPVEPGSTTTPAFTSLLLGEDAEQIILASLREPVGSAMQECARLLDRAEDRRRQLDHRWREIEADIDAAARRIVEGEFPANRLLAIVQEELQSMSIGGLAWLGRLVVTPLSKVRKLGDQFRRIWSSDPADELKSRNEYEDQQRSLRAEELIDLWRDRYRQEAQAGGILSADAIEKVSRQLRDRKLPTVTTGWEQVARDEVKRWITEHHRTAWWMANLVVISSVIGVGLLAADLVITGGVVGTLGGLALGGAGGPAGAALLRLLGSLHLQAVAEKACRSWFDERQIVLKDHLVNDLGRPLFHQWFDDRQRLANARLEDCRRASRDLESWCRHQQEVAQ